MALVKFGGGVAGISGAIGGTVFARNRAGAIARNWAKPVSAPTPIQSANRVRFGNATNAWSILTPEQREAWNGAAAGVDRLNRIGESYTPSGRQLFLQTANNLLIASLPTKTAPPVNFDPPVNEMTYTPSVTSATGIVDVIEILSGGIDATRLMLVDATAPVATNVKNNKTNLYRRLGQFPFAAGATDLTTAYVAVFGDAIPVGSTIGFRITTISVANGIQSSPLLENVVVSAA